MKTYFDSLFEDTDDSDVYNCYVDFRCGWAEAALALQAVIGAALKNGMHYEEASISKHQVSCSTTIEPVQGFRVETRGCSKSLKPSSVQAQELQSWLLTVDQIILRYRF